MRSGTSNGFGSESSSSERTPTSTGSEPRSLDLEHPVRSFAAYTAMALSIYSASLAVRLAPWRYTTPATPIPTSSNETTRQPAPDPNGGSD